MLQIALCDDETDQRGQIGELIRDYIAQCPKLCAQLRVFSSGAELLKQPAGFDVYILDAVMPRMSGIELGMKLREQGRDGAIVYLSASRDFAVDSYLVSAFHYLVKPVDRETFYEVLDRAAALIRKRRTACVQVKTKNGLRLLPVDDIFYVELKGRSARYHLILGETVDSLTFHGGFQTEMASLLAEPRFVLCGSSFAVNLYYVTAVEKSALTLSGGERVPLPRGSYQRVKRSWGDYWMDEGMT